MSRTPAFKDGPFTSYLELPAAEGREKEERAGAEAQVGERLPVV